MTADEIHDALWLYYGQQLVNGGVESIETDDIGKATVEIVLRAEGRTEIDLLIQRAPGLDPLSIAFRAIPHVILSHWVFKCQSCGAYYLRRGADVGSKHLDNDLAVCDLCAEVAGAAMEAMDAAVERLEEP